MNAHATSNAPLMLSVSGARGIVGQSMTPAVATDLAAAFGSFIRTWTRQAEPLICLGRDSRPSGLMLAAAAAAGLASVGCRVVDLGIVATPSVGVMINHRRASGGMIITASHNPAQWNGLKCLNEHGMAPPPGDVNEILRRFRERDFLNVDATHAPEISRDDSTNEIHVQRVLASIDPEPIRTCGFRVVLDSVNGAGGPAGARLLESLGCEVIHMNAVPDGNFAHVPEPLEENLSELSRVAAAEGADVGFAQDPDADRLAIVDEQGRYIGEEYTLVLCALRALEVHESGATSRDREGAVQRPILAANLSTSRMIDDIAARFAGTRVIRTAVGEANVAAAMKRDRALIGGEGNGGVIWPPVCWVRDSLAAIALTLSLLASRRVPASGRPRLSEIVADLPRYEMIKHKFDASKVHNLPAHLKKVSDTFSDARVSTIDGVRIDFADGWVHLRPSNTEPIVRLIAEATTRERAWELIDEVAVAAGLK